MSHTEVTQRPSGMPRREAAILIFNFSEKLAKAYGRIDPEEPDTPKYQQRMLFLPAGQIHWRQTYFPEDWFEWRAGDRVTQLQIWTFHTVGTFARVNNHDISIRTYRRGPWEDEFYEYSKLNGIFPWLS